MREPTFYEWLFIGEYLIDFNATRAMERIGYVGKYAGKEGYKMLKRPAVAEEVRRSVDAIKQNKRATVEMVVQDAIDVLNADPRDLIIYRQSACRYCHGVGHLYQRTEGEMRRHRQAHYKSKEWLEKGEPFEEEGGTGYDADAEPHPECPECHGVGVPNLAMRDGHQIPPDAAKLLAGYEMTKNGIKVLMRSKDAARDVLAKFQGLYKDSPTSGPSIHLNLNLTSFANMTDEELEKIARGEQ